MADEKKSAAPGDAAVIKTKKKPGKRGRGIAPFLILFFILAALTGVLVFNLFNLRNRYIYPAMARIPFIGGFVPNTAMSPEDLGAMSVDRLTARINELESQLSQSRDDLAAANDIIGSDKAEINRLKAFEAQQLQFKQEKADFDQRVAMSDPQAYADYYRSIYPENAEILYPKAAAEAERVAAVKKYLSDIKAMDEVSAANMLQQMIGSDMKLVVSIMQGLDSRIAGGILSEMNPQNAGIVIKMMSPFNMAPAAPLGQPAPDQIVNSLTDMP